MSVALTHDPVLVRFRKELAAIYGDHLDRVVLFGSRACGEVRKQSDYGVAVFLSDFRDRRSEVELNGFSSG